MFKIQIKNLNDAKLVTEALFLGRNVRREGENILLINRSNVALTFYKDIHLSHFDLPHHL